MREIERLVEAMERHWLLRKYMNLTNPPALLLSPDRFSLHLRLPLSQDVPGAGTVNLQIGWMIRFPVGLYPM
jgi:hypothetical protein